ncbi:lipopolysaccharide biosynthesis protein [Lichenicoccus roseus]|uniref:lipopolysaccharide biosynthesis protein n=1 Tax=Lichenicoccus roseus TaxID=2683649 RepID=UPI001485E745|nr:oligosaccharide flippase family protein [Lichenicoccus roseus]
MVAQFLSTLVGRGSYLALQVVLARVLGPEGFGLYAIGWTVAGLTGTLTPVGMPQAVLRYCIGGRASILSRPTIIVLIVGLAGAAGLTIGSGQIAAHIFGEPASSPIIRAFAPSVPLLGLTAVLTGSLRSSGRMLASALIGATSGLAYLVITVLMFEIHPTAVAAANAYNMSLGLILVPCIALLWQAHATEWQTPTTRQLMHFGIVTMLIHSTSVLNLWADRVVIGVVADPRTLATYQVASQFAMIMVVLRSAVTTVFEARVPKHHPSASPPDVTTEFFAATRLLLHISVPGLVVLACTSAFWVHLLFGPAYAAAALPLLVLVAGQIVATFVGPTVNALHMTGDERIVMLLMVGTALLNIAGCFILLPPLGVTGAALATGIANFTVSVACLYRLVRTGRLRFSLRWLFDIALATMICVAASLFITRFLTNGLLTGDLSADVVRPPRAVLILQTFGIVSAIYLLYAACVCATCLVEDELVHLTKSQLRRRFRRLVSS